MTAQVVRRLYFYSAAFIGLQLFAWGARSVLALLFETLLWPPAVGASDLSTGRLSTSIALLVVGLPLWAFHWIVAQRGLARPEERLSTLRRLYGYAVLVIAALSVLFSARSLLLVVFGATSFEPGPAAASALAGLLVSGAVWAYHWRVLAADRAQVERDGGQATLRRWYMVIAEGFGLGMMSYSAASLVGRLLELAIQPELGNQPGVRSAIATLIAGAAFWLPHHLWSRRLLRAASPLRASEARSTLRQVYAALVITVAAVSALGAAGILLQEALLAAFGGSRWREVIAGHTLAIGTLLVAAAVWRYQSGLLTQEARLSEEPARVDTARRVVGYLSAAIGLGALYFGVAGLAGALLNLALAPPAIGNPWRDPLSGYLAAAIVALPVYVLASQSMERLARSDPDEQRTLARRIYLYIALLFGIVVTVSSLVTFIGQVLSLSLGDSSVQSLVEAGSSFAHAAIGALIAWYYVSLLRTSGAPVPTAGSGRTIVIVAPEPLGSALAARLERDLPAAGVLRPDDAELPTALAGADTLVLTLEAALDARLAPALHAFGGRRLLIPSGAAGYEVVGVRDRADAFVQATAQRI